MKNITWSGCMEVWYHCELPLFFSIDKRRNEVLERRQRVKDKAAERHNALMGSQAFQEFKRDAAEVRISK